jgi:hypothetical protein
LPSVFKRFMCLPSSRGDLEVGEVENGLLLNRLLTILVEFLKAYFNVRITTLLGVGIVELIVLHVR